MLSESSALAILKICPFSSSLSAGFYPSSLNVTLVPVDCSYKGISGHANPPGGLICPGFSVSLPAESLSGLLLCMAAMGPGMPAGI